MSSPRSLSLLGLVWGLGFAPSVSHAFDADVGSCMTILTENIQKEFDLKRWTFNGISSINPSQINPKLALYSGAKVELKPQDRAEILDYSTQPGHEFFLLTGTSNYSVSFMDVLVVRSEDCRLVDRKTVYFD